MHKIIWDLGILILNLGGIYTCDITVMSSIMSDNADENNEKEEDIVIVDNNDDKNDIGFFVVYNIYLKKNYLFIYLLHNHKIIVFN